MTAPVIHRIDLTDPPGDGLVYAEILTEAGVIRVNVNLVKVSAAHERRVVVEIEPNYSLGGIIKTAPGGHWDVEFNATRTDVTLTRKEGT